MGILMELEANRGNISFKRDRAFSTGWIQGNLSLGDEYCDDSQEPIVRGTENLTEDAEV